MSRRLRFETLADYIPVFELIHFGIFFLSWCCVTIYLKTFKRILLSTEKIHPLGFQPKIIIPNISLSAPIVAAFLSHRFQLEHFVLGHGPPSSINSAIQNKDTLRQILTLNLGENVIAKC